VSEGIVQPAPPRYARRGIVVLGIVALALLAFGSTTQTWLTVRLPQDAVQTPDLMIVGSDASTPVTAFALVALAAALAVSIAGRVARWIIAVVLVLSGVGIVLSSASVAADPAAAAEPAIGAALGVSGLAGADSTATAMPWLAVVAGALLVLAAAWMVLAGRAWGLNKRYDAGASRVARAPGETLRPGGPSPSTGDLPPGVVPGGADTSTAPRADAPTPPAAGLPAIGDERRSAHSDEIDSWDELSRGNDPTR